MKKKESGQPESWEQEVWESRPLMARSDFKKDTLLTCWCPHCKQGLNDGDKAVLEIENRQGQVGTSGVIASLNVLGQESTIQVDDDEELADVRCPHCRTSLIEPDRLCKEDQCKLVGIHVSVSNSARLKLIACIRPFSPQERRRKRAAAVPLLPRSHGGQRPRNRRRGKGGRGHALPGIAAAFPW